MQFNIPSPESTQLSYFLEFFFIFFLFKDYGSERRTSLTKASGRRLYGRQLTNNSDSEQAIANAMTHKYVNMVNFFVI